MADTKSKPAVGDLVVCRYDLDYFYYPNPNVNHNWSPSSSIIHMGIILSCKEDHYMFYAHELVYEVLCTDGARRLFTEWEIEIVRRAKKSP